MWIVKTKNLCIAKYTFNFARVSFLQHLSETVGIHPGDGELFINGLHIDLDVHNPFRWDYCSWGGAAAAGGWLYPWDAS